MERLRGALYRGTGGENDCIAHFIEAVPQQVVQDLEDMVRKGCGPGIILHYYLLL